METEKTKIALYAKRTFGEKFNATFDFIKENWKLLLKYTLYLLLPVSLIQALSLNGLMSAAMGMSAMVSNTAAFAGASAMVPFFVYYGLFLIVALVGTALLMSLVYAMLRTYNEREERLQGVTLGMLRPMLLHNVKRTFFVLLFGMFLMIVVSLLFGVVSVAIPASALPYVVFLFILVLFAVVLPLGLWIPAYLLEDLTLIGSLKKALRIGFATWGGIFAIAFVMGIISGILQGVTMIPWYIGTIVKYVLGASSGEGIGDVSVGYSFLLYLLAVVQALGAYFAMIFALVGLGYQYGHASEKIDSVMVDSDISNFDKL